jgi:hypothetical protein
MLSTQPNSKHLEAAGLQLRHSCLRMANIYEELDQLRKQLSTIKSGSDSLMADIQHAQAEDRQLHDAPGVN